MAGYDVDYKQIIVEDSFLTEIASTLKLLNLIKSGVTASIQHQSFPIVLSGNCSASLGVVAGLNREDAGVIWLYVHADCETSETTTSGFLDGMALSMLTYSCWHNLLSSFKPHTYTSIAGKHIVLIGARDLSNHEKDFISDNAINHITTNQIKHYGQKTINSACSKLIESGIKKLHLHIDGDVIDPSIAPANSYSVNNGLSKENLIDIINYCINEIPVCSATIASYDPSFDIDDRMLAAIYELIEIIVKGKY